MPKTDIRAQLEAIAAGRALKSPPGASVIDTSTVEKHQADFRAWHHFTAEQAGEPLAAPSEILAPLP